MSKILCNVLKISGRGANAPPLVARLYAGICVRIIFLIVYLSESF